MHLDYRCWTLIISRWPTQVLLTINLNHPTSLFLHELLYLLFMPRISVVSPSKHVVCDICNCSFHTKGFANHQRSCKAKQGKINDASVFHHKLEELARIKKEARGKPPRIEGEFIKVGSNTLHHSDSNLFFQSEAPKMKHSKEAKLRNPSPESESEAVSSKGDWFPLNIVSCLMFKSQQYQCPQM